jgi:hypothetical protein
VTNVTGNYTVPANTNAVASAAASDGTVRITATGTIEIDGTITLPAGAAIILSADTIVLNGSIGSAASIATSSNARGAASARRTQADPTAPAPPPPDILIATSKIALNGSVNATASQTVDIVADGPNTTISIGTQGITLPIGLSGTGTTPTGTAGGSIEIGTAKADTDAASAGSLGGRSAGVPAVLTLVDARLTAGAGGQGRCDPSGTINANGANGPEIDYLNTGNGGVGGWVEVLASQIAVTGNVGSDFLAGTGGSGGTIGGCNDATGKFVAAAPAGQIDRIGNNGNGLNLLGATGNGGAGGSVSGPTALLPQVTFVTGVSPRSTPMVTLSSAQVRQPTVRAWLAEAAGARRRQRARPPTQSRSHHPGPMGRELRSR